jgi:broad specificity phosphatase PhoE
MLGLLMAIIRRSNNPWMRAMMALKPAVATIIVVRHGSTGRNLGGVGRDQIRGHADIPMTEAGEQEVRVTAYQIADVKLEVIHTSDLKRAHRTAEILSDENVGGPPIEASSQLRSWDMGPSMEGKVTTPEVVAQIRSWVENDTVVPPGGESFRAYVGRLLGYVQPVCEAAVRDGATLAIVSHGRTAQIIDFWVAAGCDEACMHQEFSEYLAEEPDTIPPGGGIHYKHDGLGWTGQVIPNGKPSLGTQVASGARIERVNEAI